MKFFRLLLSLILLLVLPMETTLAAGGAVCGEHGAAGGSSFSGINHSFAENGHHHVVAVLCEHDAGGGQHNDRTANCATCGAVSLLFAPGHVVLSYVSSGNKGLAAITLHDPNPFLDTLKRPPKRLLV